MSYDEDELVEERSFKDDYEDGDPDETFEPMDGEEELGDEFGFDDDPDKDH